jgi:hypothetical protein
MMPIASPAIDVLFRNYADLLLRRHYLLLAGKEDDPETDDVENLLAIAWDKLNELQRHSLNGMASDLNWVRRRGTPPPQGRRPDEVLEGDRQLLAEAEQAKDWLAALHYLRVCAPVLDTEDLARRRAAAYTGLGLPTFAELCRHLASRTNGAVTVAESAGDARSAAKNGNGTRDHLPAAETPE